MMRKIGAALLAVSMMSSTVAVAATPAKATQGALAPGKAAGVKQAQLTGNALFWLIGLGVLAGGIILVTTGNSDGTVTSTTNTTP